MVELSTINPIQTQKSESKWGIIIGVISLFIALGALGISIYLLFFSPSQNQDNGSGDGGNNGGGGGGSTCPNLSTCNVSSTSITTGNVISSSITNSGLINTNSITIGNTGSLSSNKIQGVSFLEKNKDATQLNIVGNTYIDGTLSAKNFQLQNVSFNQIKSDLAIIKQSNLYEQSIYYFTEKSSEKFNFNIDYSASDDCYIFSSFRIFQNTTSTSTSIRGNNVNLCLSTNIGDEDSDIVFFNIILLNNTLNKVKGLCFNIYIFCYNGQKVLLQLNNNTVTNYDINIRYPSSTTQSQKFLGNAVNYTLGDSKSWKNSYSRVLFVENNQIFWYGIN